MMKALQTAFCEVEAILNDCPITTASDDPNDLEALRPNHLLLLKGKTHHATRAASEGGLVIPDEDANRFSI